MEIKVLMENTAFEKGFLIEHGLSLHIETHNHKILFDMGGSDRFLENAKKLGVDLADADAAVLSHGHYDHGGGLPFFLSVNGKAPVYVSRYAFEPHISSSGEYGGLEPSLEQNPRLIRVGEALKLDNELELYACNDRKREYYMDPYGLCVQRGGAILPDDFLHEHYLLIREGDKRVLISGCSHKGVLNIANWLRPDVLIGGFHFMNVDPHSEDRKTLDEAARVLLGFDTQYYTCHCTGVPQYEYMKQSMGDRLRYLAAGQTVTI